MKIIFLFSFIIFNFSYSQGQPKGQPKLVNGHVVDKAIQAYDKRCYRTHDIHIEKLKAFFSAESAPNWDTICTLLFTKSQNRKNLEVYKKDNSSIRLDDHSLSCVVIFPISKAENLTVHFEQNEKKEWIVKDIVGYKDKLMNNKKYSGTLLTTFFADFVADFNSISKTQISSTYSHDLYIKLKNDDKKTYFKFSYYSTNHKEGNDIRWGYLLSDFSNNLQIEKLLLTKEISENQKKKDKEIPKELIKTKKISEVLVSNSQGTYYNIKFYFDTNTDFTNDIQYVINGENIISIAFPNYITLDPDQVDEFMKKRKTNNEITYIDKQNLRISFKDLKLKEQKDNPYITIAKDTIGNYVLFKFTMTKN